MKIVRTIVWVLLFVALLIFSVNNWEPGVTVKIWDNLVVDTKLPAVVILSFLIGLVPMWMVHRASRWNYDRRIASLESAARAAAVPPVAPAPPVHADPLPEEPRAELSATDETKPTP